MTTARRMVTALGLAAAVVLAGPAAASAHPLGNFTLNAYSGITVHPGSVRIEYVLDFAEIPTFQERSRIDVDDDGLVEEDERSAWAERQAEGIGAGLSLQVDGRPVSLVLERSSAAFLPGQAGLDVLRLEATYRAAVPSAGRAMFHDGNDRGRIGWREITAVGTDGVAVTGSSVPAGSVSDALRAYPEERLSRPMDVRTATFTFGPGRQGPAAGLSSAPTAGRPGGDALVALVGRPSLSLPMVVVGLLVAFGVGTLHALAPGHGKTLTAAYLTGSGGTVRQAIGAGVAVSVMHTLSVSVIAAIVLFAQRAFPAERVYPWLGLAAGLTATALGGGLLLARVRSRGHGHAHVNPLSRRGLLAVAVSGGLLPSPSALVVLVAAVTLGRVAFGLGLIAAFGLGLAGAIGGIGVLAVRAREAAARRSWERLTRWLPIAGAAAILLVGLVLTGRAVAQL
ncbi:MAG: nickel/cobalt transporter [Actinomycetota bacterium]